ncbi:MAG: laccase domain-containing protein, partial [Prevotella sp.]|nr:laccase domain-containing protein [Prevotella sp.]
DEVYRQFAEAAFPMQSVASMIGEKWHIDLWECNRLQLLGLGVLPENIFVSGICTYTQHTDYFSARRLGVESGRIFTGILMR